MWGVARRISSCTFSKKKKKKWPYYFNKKLPMLIDIFKNLILGIIVYDNNKNLFIRYV